MVCTILFEAWASSHKMNRRLVDDDCGRPSSNAPKVQMCSHVHERNHKSCSYPSAPRNLVIKFKFNNATRKFEIKVNWDVPEYGVVSLWGFEVILDHRCYQMNIKKKQAGYSFVIPEELRYNKIGRTKQYHVLVSSLPRSSRDYKNSIEQNILLPDKCKIFSKYGITDSADCVKITNLVVYSNCKVGVNKSSIINFPWPNSQGYDGIEFYYETQNSCSSGNQNGHEVLLKNDSVFGSFTIESMVEDCEYTILAKAFKASETDDERRSRDWQRQLTLRCKGAFRAADGFTSPPPQQNQTQSIRKKNNQKQKITILVVIVLISLFSLLAVIIVAVRKRIVTRRGSQNLYKSILQKAGLASSSKHRPAVMIVWSHGCKATEDFVLLLAAFLHHTGFTTSLDLLENNAIVEMGGTATYLINREESADFVIIVCTGEEDNSFKFILDVIKNKVISTGSRSRYIPIHFEKLPWQHVPVWLQSMTYRLPDKIEQIIQRMHNIQPYEISAIPFRNMLIVDESRLEELKKAANLVSKSEHKECDLEQCGKGVSDSTCYVDDTSSINSFQTYDGSIYKEDSTSCNSFQPIEEEGVVLS